MLDIGAYKFTKWLQNQGFKSIYFTETTAYPILWEQYNAGYTTFIPSFNHMAAAVAAGLGTMGVSGVVLTPQFGPRQRWITILTEAPLTYGVPTKKELCLEKKMEACLECVHVCPVHAIDLSEGTDVRKCWIHWTDLRAKGMACGQCIKVCPVGK